MDIGQFFRWKILPYLLMQTNNIPFNVGHTLYSVQSFPLDLIWSSFEMWTIFFTFNAVHTERFTVMMCVALIVLIAILFTFSNSLNSLTPFMTAFTVLFAILFTYVFLCNVNRFVVRHLLHLCIYLKRIFLLLHPVHLK